MNSREALRTLEYARPGGYRRPIQHLTLVMGILGILVASVSAVGYLIVTLALVPEFLNPQGGESTLLFLCLVVEAASATLLALLLSAAATLLLRRSRRAVITYRIYAGAQLVVS